MSESFPPGRRRRPFLAMAAIIGAAAILWLWFSATPHLDDPARPDPPPPDPRSVFETRHRNVRPDVKYVGDEACAGCHAEIARTYRNHPMGRSAEWVGRGPAADAHAAGSNNPVSAGTYQLRAGRDGDRVRHAMTATNLPAGAVPPYAVFADLAIGSGRQGKSYFSLDGGSVWQSPLSRFRRGDRWDVSPGFELGAASRRPVTPSCLFCHADTVSPVDGAINRYREPLFAFQPSIGCERCHGPGELHVAERSAKPAPGGIDDSIVNPAHLAADLKGDVCRQCHLQAEMRVDRRGRTPFDYRPGLPLEQFVSVFVNRPDSADAQKSVGQFEQMEGSRCYTASAGKMSCTSCHDPHAVPAEPAAHFRTKCLTCHADRGCSAPAGERTANGDSCTACHMPARDSSNIVHAAVTDHRILRRPGAVEKPAGRPIPPGESPVIAYRAGPHAPPAEERDRDAAILFTREIVRAAGPVSPELLRVTREKVDASLARWPGDSACWTASAALHGSRGNKAQALAAARRAVAIAPQSEPALARLAECAAASEDFKLMAETGARLVELNPASADHRAALATALVGQKDWTRAESAARAALEIHPLHPNARLLLGVCRDRLGDPRAGRTELESVMKLIASPAQRATMSEWYLRQIR